MINNFNFLKNFYIIFLILTFYFTSAYPKGTIYHRTVENADFDKPLSVVVAGSNKLIISNYSEIVCIDFEKNKTLPIEFNIVLIPKAVSGKKGNFHPTGIFYDSSVSVLFVANYHVKNVLLFSFDLNTNAASFLYEIKDKSLTGPEDLTYDKKTNTLFITDNDSDKVFAFKIDLAQKSYKKIWETNINIPHGIDYKYGRLFVTSMRDRSINELDPITGKPIMVFGKIGMDKNH